MKPRFNRFNFETWAKRQTMRKLGNDDDRTEAERIARKAWPDLTSEQAFSKMFCDTSPAGETLRRAVNVAKQAGQLDASAAYQVGGDDATDVDDPRAALDELKQLIAEMRGRARDLSESDAWNRVVAANPVLAKRAFARPAMTSVYPFPRV